jgi:APA family basic amino acid/polyamine antiporter
VVSIAAQGVWSSILVLSGTFSQLASYTGFAIVLFAGIAVAGLFVLRWREPDAPRRSAPGAIRWRRPCSPR